MFYVHNTPIQWADKATALVYVNNKQQQKNVKRIPDSQFLCITVYVAVCRLQQMQ